MQRDQVILAAHGSRDPRAAATVRQIGRAVAAARPGDDVTCAFLDFEEPALASTLRPGRRTVVVPLLLTSAYHARVDIPAIVDVARSRGSDVEIASPLGGDGLGAQRLASALQHRLPRGPAVDGIVVATAGSRDPGAAATIDGIAAELARQSRLPCRAGHVTGAGTPVAEAVAGLRASGVREIGLAMCFVAPGLLPERAMAAARELGVRIIGAPLGDAPDMVELVNTRVNALQLAAAR